MAKALIDVMNESGADDLLVNVYQIMGNARAKAASRLDEILVDEQQNNAVFRDLAKDAAQGDRSVHTPFAGANACTSWRLATETDGIRACVRRMQLQQRRRLREDWAAQRRVADEDRQLQQWSDGILTDTQTLVGKVDAAEEGEGQEEPAPAEAEEEDTGDAEAGES